MPNLHRGEIEACFDGRRYTLCLTLGALAELEAAFGDDDMLALAERFSTGRISARDASRVIAAGLRGAGHDLDEASVGRLKAEGGAAGYVDVVARLLAATFGGAAGAGGARPGAPAAGVGMGGPGAQAHDAGARAPMRASADPDAQSLPVRTAPDPFPGAR